MRNVINKAGSGVKALLLDEETIKIISLLLSQSELLELQVFLVEKLGGGGTETNNGGTQERSAHFGCVVFVRPTDKNILALVNELQSPRFAKYFLNFTNTVDPTHLEKIACRDEESIVTDVCEVLADFHCVNRHLFSLELETTSMMMGCLRREWSPCEEVVYSRTLGGLYASCVALGMDASIRYVAGSHLCEQLAKDLQVRVRGEAGQASGAKKKAGVVLVFDRREDPVTPLLSQWTYQAMVHELLTIDSNRIRAAPGASREEVVLSEAEDDFFDGTQGWRSVARG